MALVIGFANIKAGYFYSGWDNVHGEFDLSDYARQVFFGAWSEHQSLGGPSAQGQPTEIFRLPIIFLLSLFVPVNNIRLVFIFSMFLVGGVGMYFYLSRIWLAQKSDLWKRWLASLGSIFYLLHILTLQQFYISFEMFMVQFAFLPFLLMSIHALLNKLSIKNVFYFIALQFLIAPSAHTQTVFYLAVLFSLIYSFFLTLQKKNLWHAIRMSFLVGLLTFFANSYWIFPNLYYSFHNAHYVQESRDNQLFAPESVWSIREAGTIENLTSGMHYLFSWQDYSFEKEKHELIFNEWQDHFSQPLVIYSMRILGVITLLGFLITIFSKDKDKKRWAIIAMYLFCFIFIWIDLLPTSKILDELYKSGTFREAFRNPFTKLSILYSFVSIILFITVVEKTILGLIGTKKLKKLTSLFAIIIFSSLFLSQFIISWPSFKGHFISEKLQIKYPGQYWEMFDYLETRDKDLRVLQLPQFTHAGWEYYDWQFLEEGNGYQGMGFYYFGFPQAFLNRDSDRWIETSDFFYYELKHALDSYNTEHFLEIVEKYNVDLVIIDETRFDPSKDHDFSTDRFLLEDAGFKKVWEKDFLNIYERSTDGKEEEVLLPKTIQFVDADLDRVRRDYAYSTESDYILDKENYKYIFPFSSLISHRLSNVIFEDNSLKILSKVPKGNYLLTIPGIDGDKYFSPAAISYDGQKVTVDFPSLSLVTEKQRVSFYHLDNFELELKEKDKDSIVIFFNDFGVIVEKGETVYPAIEMTIGEDIKIEYGAKPEEIEYGDDGIASGLSFDVDEVFAMEPNWSELTKEYEFETEEIETIGLASSFPGINIDLSKNPSVNCVDSELGNIETKLVDGEIIYEANLKAVNCNGYFFKDVTSAYSYVMKISGKNVQGRGTKFFVNYSNSNILTEDYLEQDDSFNSFITLAKVTDDSRETFYLNWETRSFGKESVDVLNSIQLQPFPLNRFSQIRLSKSNDVKPIENMIKVSESKKYLDSIFKIKYECSSEKCYLGIDQTFDDLWLAFDKEDKKILNHYRLNNWANIWEINNSNGELIIIYLPELVAFSSFILVIVSFVAIGLISFSSSKSIESNEDEELSE